MEYLLILLFLLIVSMFLEWKYKMKLYNSRRERFLIPLIFFIIGIIWDSIGVLRGHWVYEGPGLVGITIGVLPIEDYFFVLVVPYFILTTYKVLKKEI